MTEWHDDDTFWKLMAPFMFDEARWIGTEAEIDYISTLAGVQPGTAVLDLGCGPGRHALELARRGCRVVGVDRTAEYLRQAREKAREEGLDVEFVEGDMRSFARPASFDLALSLYTAFGYFEQAAENEQVLRNAYISLRPGAVLLLEVAGKEVIARDFQERDWTEQGGELLLQERRAERHWTWMQNRWIVVRDGQQRSFEVGHWIYSAAELDHMLRLAGFTAVDFYGDLEGRPYDHHARRLVALARR
jgi:SAM-dependent methyltransferase